MPPTTDLALTNTPAHQPANIEEFLARSRRDGGPAEFIQGRVERLPSPSLAHQTIAGNLFAALHAGADGLERLVFQSVAVEVPGVGVFRPDVVFGTRGTAVEEAHLRNPQIVVEVMAPDTAARDRGLKWKALQSLAALWSYVLVDESEWAVEVFSRGADDRWIYERLDASGDKLVLPVIQFSMPLTAVYRGVFRA